MKTYSTLKGVSDILEPDIFLWKKVEETASKIFGNFGYIELRVPIIEPTELFIRSIGETSDIVTKEMYTFPDRAGRSITLRPEGTASLVRAYIQHGLQNSQPPWKYYYMGPMFRYERPQKGRFRQFYQIGAELLGNASPSADAEVIAMIDMLLRQLNLDHVVVEINSTGCSECRPLYRARLIEFFTDGGSPKKDNLCADCKVRLDKNPLRILDCKVDSCKSMRQNAPVITASVCENCADHYEEFKALLDSVNIPYKENSEIVRGLDYYTKTVFEVTTEHLGAQKAVAAGGRYDNLVEDFGGPKTPAFGFAMGVERLVELLKDKVQVGSYKPFVFFAILGKSAQNTAFSYSIRLQKEGIYTESGQPNQTLKSQMKRANRMEAAFVAIIGDEEVEKKTVVLRDLVLQSQEVIPDSVFYSHICEKAAQTDKSAPWFNL